MSEFIRRSVGVGLVLACAVSTACGGESPERDGAGGSGWTRLLLGTEWVSQVLPPITEPLPTTVSPPRMVAPG